VQTSSKCDLPPCVLLISCPVCHQSPGSQLLESGGYVVAQSWECFSPLWVKIIFPVSRWWKHAWTIGLGRKKEFHYSGRRYWQDIICWLFSQTPAFPHVVWWPPHCGGSRLDAVGLILSLKRFQGCITKFLANYSSSFPFLLLLWSAIFLNIWMCAYNLLVREFIFPTLKVAKVTHPYTVSWQRTQLKSREFKRIRLQEVRVILVPCITIFPRSVDFHTSPIPA
jgi:hypothetical protein